MSAALDQLEALLAVRDSASSVAAYWRAQGKLDSALVSGLPALLACARALEPFAKTAGMIVPELADDKKPGTWATHHARDYRAAAEALKRLEAGG